MPGGLAKASRCVRGALQLQSHLSAGRGLSAASLKRNGKGRSHTQLLIGAWSNHAALTRKTDTASAGAGDRMCGDDGGEGSALSCSCAGCPGRVLGLSTSWEMERRNLANKASHFGCGIKSACFNEKKVSLLIMVYKFTDMP